MRTTMSPTEAISELIESVQRQEQAHSSMCRLQGGGITGLGVEGSEPGGARRNVCGQGFGRRRNKEQYPSKFLHQTGDLFGARGLPTRYSDPVLRGQHRFQMPEGICLFASHRVENYLCESISGQKNGVFGTEDETCAAPYFIRMQEHILQRKF